MTDLVCSLLLLLPALVAHGQGVPPTDHENPQVRSESFKIPVYDPVSKVYFQPQPYYDPGLSFAEFTDVQGHSTKIAILDSGVLHDHPLLQGIKIVDKDFTGEGPEDRYGHGTLSLLLSLGQMPSYMLSNTQFFNVKVLDKDGRGDPDNIRRGMEWAVGEGAEVLGMALGVPKILAPELCEYATQLLKANPSLVIVAANGNDPSFEMCPAAALGVKAAAASEKPMKPLVLGRESLTPIAAPPSDDATLKFPKEVILESSPKPLPLANDGGAQASLITGPGNIVLVPLGVHYQPYTEIDRATLAEPFQRAYVEAFNSRDFIKTHAMVRQSPDQTHNLATVLAMKVMLSERLGNCAQAIASALLLRQVHLESDGQLENTLYHLGVAYRCNGEYPRAALAFGEAADKYISWGERRTAAIILNLLGQLEAVDERLPEVALATFKRSVEVALNGSEAENAEADALGNICLLEFTLGDFDHSLVDCLDVSRRSGARYKNYWTGESLLQIGRIYEARNDPSQAAEYLEKARSICVQDGDKVCEEAAASHLSKVKSSLH